jgi:hypothetical protein
VSVTLAYEFLLSRRRFRMTSSSGEKTVSWSTEVIAARYEHFDDDGPCRSLADLDVPIERAVANCEPSYRDA